MPRRKPWIWYTTAALMVAGLSGCATLSTRTQTAAALDSVLASPHRPETDRARDIHRHPKETLLFFGLRPEMTVLELTPGAGWYTRVLAPVLRERGRLLVGFTPLDEANPNSVRHHEGFRAMLAAAPGLLDRVQIVGFAPGRGPLTAPESSVDLVLTFRSVHNWMAADTTAAALADIHRVLKPGGVLGVVDHRANAALPVDPRAANGYVSQSHAIRMIEEAGFRLVATSEINANPQDTKDYPGGVWTLPPVLAEGEKERERYLAIGESDRFTLKFVKPR